MIKFFRQIRRSLIQKNQMGKYFKYAIGEILLVVIGILIALQINNWNEERINNIIIKKYYNQILEEIKIDNQRIDKIILFQKNDSIKFKNYEDIYKKDDLPIDTIFKQLKKISSFYQTMTFSTNTIQVLKSSGDIKLLPNNIQLGIVKLNTLQQGYLSSNQGNTDDYGNMMSGAYLANLVSLESKLDNQKILANALNFKQRLPDQIAKIHAALTYKNILDNSNSKSLRAIKKANNTLSELIEKQLK